MPQKLTTTACFIQEESSGGKQFRKHVSCFMLKCSSSTSADNCNCTVVALVQTTVTVGTRKHVHYRISA